MDCIFAYLYCEFFNVKLGFDAQQKGFCGQCNFIYI